MPNQLQPRNTNKPKRDTRPSRTPVTESDKLMEASETYIGPHKKKGRPRTVVSENRNIQQPPNILRSRTISQTSANRKSMVIGSQHADNVCKPQSPRPPLRRVKGLMTIPARETLLYNHTTQTQDPRLPSVILEGRMSLISCLSWRVLSSPAKMRRSSRL